MLVGHKISKYDIARIENLKHVIKLAKDNFNAKCEAMFISLSKEPNKKTNYPHWHAWKVKHETLKRAWSKALQTYQINVIRLNALEEQLTLERLKDE